MPRPIRPRRYVDPTRRKRIVTTATAFVFCIGAALFQLYLAAPNGIPAVSVMFAALAAISGGLLWTAIRGV